MVLPKEPANLGYAAPAANGRRFPRLARTGRRLPSGRWRWLVAGVVACLALAGVGWAVWPSQPATPSLHLVAGTVQADLLTPDQVSRLSGVTVVSGPGSGEPPAAISAGPARCAPVAGPATQAVYGHSWTAFLSATDEVADGSGDYTVNQVVGVFPNSAKAAAAFRALAGGVARCPSAQIKGRAGQSTAWAYTSYPATSVAVAWTATQAGGNGWACYHQAQVSGTALVQAAVCEAGDGGPAASALANALAGRVSK